MELCFLGYCGQLTKPNDKALAAKSGSLEFSTEEAIAASYSTEPKFKFCLYGICSQVRPDEDARRR